MHQKEKSEYYVQLEREVIRELKTNLENYQQYLELDEEWRQRFLDFCTGLRTMPLTYDPFFKKIFHPDTHPERLSRFISSLIGKEVKVVQILPTEDSMFGKDTLLVMDILVELEDGSLANVEVQKIPYAFPAERMSCYSADLLLRQYSRVKGERGKNFKYNNIKKVYLIILFEKSTKIFHEHKDECIHIGKTTFNTGLGLELLQEYWLVALDVFKKKTYPKDISERTAWLKFLTTETIEEALEVAREYPWLVEIYKEIEDYMKNPEEVLNMYSEALRILDRNTVKYMVEEQQAEIEEQRRILAEQSEQIAEQSEQIAEQSEQIAEQNKKIAEQEKELEELRRLLKK